LGSNRSDEFRIDGASDAAHTLILAHGAGAPMDSGFMKRVASGVSDAGIRVVRFEFPYMAKRREGGGRGAPDRPAVLTGRWKEVIEHFGGGSRVAIGGKSMGGRIASMVADEVGARGLVCLGYPFHPPGAPEKTRTAHLAQLQTPTLIVQGSRDAFGGRDEIAGYALSPAIRVVYLEGGDHSFKPPAKSGRTEAQNLAEAIELVTAFVLSH
jgi:predicted alpha/beta-hydrolase family hydrolase